MWGNMEGVIWFHAGYVCVCVCFTKSSQGVCGRLHHTLLLILQKHLNTWWYQCKNKSSSCSTLCHRAIHIWTYSSWHWLKEGYTLDKSPGATDFWNQSPDTTHCPELTCVNGMNNAGFCLHVGKKVSLLSLVVVKGVGTGKQKCGGKWRELHMLHSF